MRVSSTLTLELLFTTCFPMPSHIYSFYEPKETIRDASFTYSTEAPRSGSDLAGISAESRGSRRGGQGWRLRPQARPGGP